MMDAIKWMRGVRQHEWWEAEQHRLKLVRAEHEKELRNKQSEKELREWIERVGDTEKPYWIDLILFLRGLWDKIDPKVIEEMLVSFTPERKLKDATGNIQDILSFFDVNLEELKKRWGR